jgi:hypothetical protein
MYVTDPGREVIEVVSLDTKMRSVSSMFFIQRTPALIGQFFATNGPAAAKNLDNKF